MTSSHDQDAADRGRRARERMASGPDVFCGYYYPRLVRFLTPLASDTRWAEDVAQETLMAALDKWDDLQRIDRPDSWLYKVAISKLHRLQARARERCILNEDRASSAVDLQLASVTDEWVEEHVDLITALRSLPRRQVEVIILHFYGGYTLRETAEILEVAEGTVKTHLDRGLKSLRQHQGVPVHAKPIRKVPV